MQIYKLWQITNITNWYPFQSWKFNSDWKWLLVLRIQNMDNWLNDNSKYRDHDYPLNVVINEGDILVSLSWSFKIEKWNFWKALLNQRIIKIEPKPELDKRYMFYILKTKLNEIKTRATNTSIPNISVNDIKNLELSLPRLLTQFSIATKLDKLQSLIDLKKQSIAKTDDLAKSIFLEMFGDPVVNPKKWEINKFGDIGKLDRGVSKHRPRNAPELLWWPYPLIQTGDVANSNWYITEYKSTYSELWLKQSKMWSKWTLCITIAANIAKTGILTFDACFPDSVVWFLPCERSKTEYVKYWLSFLQKILEESAPESAQKNINLDILRKLDIPLPPLPFQQKFADIISKLEKTKEKNKQALAKLEELYQSEMQKSFSV